MPRSVGLINSPYDIIVHVRYKRMTLMKLLSNFCKNIFGFLRFPNVQFIFFTHAYIYMGYKQFQPFKTGSLCEFYGDASMKVKMLYLQCLILMFLSHFGRKHGTGPGHYSGMWLSPGRAQGGGRDFLD